MFALNPISPIPLGSTQSPYLNIPTLAAPGSALAPALQITNSGPGAAQGTELTNYYLSSTPGITSSSILIGTSSESIDLSNGGSFSETPNLTVPATMPPGSYYLVAQVNAEQAIVESDYTNDTEVSGPIQVGRLTQLTPAQIYSAYGFTAIPSPSGTLPGAGQTIAIVTLYNNPDIQTDLAHFDTIFNLPDPTLTVVNQSGGSNLPGLIPPVGGNPKPR